MARAAPPASKQQPAAAANRSGTPQQDLDPALVATVEALAAKLDGMDYFQVLGLQAGAGFSDIKKAYYALSRKYHPDRFYRLDNEPFKQRVGDIYKRVNEAYVILRDDQKRTKYAADIAGAERQAKLRFTETSEAEVRAEAKRQVEELVGKTPQGRKFYEQGMKDFGAGRFVEAERNFKTALTFEPANQKYKEMFNAAGKNIKMDFTIK